MQRYVSEDNLGDGHFGDRCGRGGGMLGVCTIVCGQLRPNTYWSITYFKGEVERKQWRARYQRVGGLETPVVEVNKKRGAQNIVGMRLYASLIWVYIVNGGRNAKPNPPLLGTKSEVKPFLSLLDLLVAKGACNRVA
jgi:hypothetical protein